MAAIYTPLWPPVDVYVTTTLYPVDAMENFQIDIAILSGTMTVVPGDEVQTTFDVQPSTYTQLRWFYTEGPFDDDVQTTFDVQNSTYTQERWFYTSGPHDDDVQTTFDVQDSDYISKLIEAETEVDEMQLDMVILSSSSMSAV